MSKAAKVHFSTRAFLRGLVVVVALYALLGLYLFLKSSDTVAGLEQRLAVQTVLLDRSSGSETGYPEMDYDDSGFNTVPDFSGSESLPLGADVLNAQTAPSSEPHAAVVQQKRPLVPAPLAGMYEMSTAGRLPVVSSGGQRPFDGYKKPFSDPLRRPLIAVVVSDFGMSDSVSREMLNSLPENVTMMLSPYVSDAQGWQKLAREMGHEVWLDIPAETSGYPDSDQGMMAVSPRMSLTQNVEQLLRVMATATGYAGVVLYSDEAFGNNREALLLILDEVSKRGLGFLEKNPDGSTAATSSLLEGSPYYAAVDMNMDGVSMKPLENIARENGFAVGVISPAPNALQALDIWLETLEAKGIVLAPLSAVIDRARAASPAPDFAP